MRNNQFSILSVDDSASADGNQVDVGQIYSASFHVYFGDDTAEGTLKIQVSNQPASQGPPSSFLVTEWVDLPSASAAITAGEPALITVSSMSYRWVRAVWTRTSGGSTTINVLMNVQGY